jgi:hypothetical protein
MAQVESNLKKASEEQKKRERQQQMSDLETQIASQTFFALLNGFLDGATRGFKEMATGGPVVMVGDTVHVCTNKGSCRGKATDERKGEIRVRFDENCPSLSLYDKYLNENGGQWIPLRSVISSYDYGLYTCPY